MIIHQTWFGAFVDTCILIILSTHKALNIDLYTAVLLAIEFGYLWAITTTHYLTSNSVHPVSLPTCWLCTKHLAAYQHLITTIESYWSTSWLLTALDPIRCKVPIQLIHVSLITGSSVKVGLTLMIVIVVFAIQGSTGLKGPSSLRWLGPTSARDVSRIALPTAFAGARG